MKKIYLLATIAALLAACSEAGEPTPQLSAQAVNFTARIAANPQTRTTAGGDSWVTGDMVGVYMLASGADMLAANVAYTVADAATGALHSNAPIYYPQSGSVDFVAYYPYGSPTGGTLALTVAGQTTEAAQNALDVLYAKTTGVTKTRTTVGLTFNHVLSKVTLNIKAGTGIAAGEVSALAAGGIAFGGMPASATLDLQDSTLAAGAAAAFSPLKAAAPTASFDATFTALVVPQPAGGTGRTAVFTVNGGQYTWNIPDTEAFKAGEHYVYPVTVNRTGITVGAPSIADWTTRDNGSGAATEIGAGISKVFIPAGTFQMGSPETGAYLDIFETQHEVTLTQDFYMSKYEITSAQYAEFLNAVSAPEADNEGYVSWDVAGFDGQQQLFQVNEWGWTPKWDDVESSWVVGLYGGNTPMINVTWYGAKAYADWVGGALPTEAQWEYACRAESTTAYSYGTEANGDYMWYLENSGGNLNVVGQKTPNAWGLYDMHGNVWEWCADWYDEHYYNDPEAGIDPTGPATGRNRVQRGASWGSNADACRSAYRYYGYPGNDGYSLGFRVVFPLP